MLADGRVSTIGAIEADDRDISRIAVHDRHVYRRGFAPEAQQGPAPLCQLARGELPKVRIDRDARPWMMWLDRAAFQHQVNQRWHVTRIPSLSKQTSHVL